MIAIPMAVWTAPGSPEAFTAPCCGNVVRPKQITGGMRLSLVQWELCDCMREAESLRQWASMLDDRAKAEAAAREAERTFPSRQYTAQQRALDRLWPEWSRGPRLQRATFDTYLPSTAKATIVRDRLRQYVAAYVPGQTERGIALMGPVGTGKSHLSSALAHSLRARLVLTVFVSVTRLLATLRASYGDKTVDQEAPLLHSLRTVPVLILDDLGADRPSEPMLERLFDIFDARYTHCLPTVVTMNWNLKDLRDYVGERIASRITEMCEPLVLTGQDYRLQTAKKIRGPL